MIAVTSSNGIRPPTSNRETAGSNPVVTITMSVFKSHQAYRNLFKHGKQYTCMSKKDINISVDANSAMKRITKDIDIDYKADNYITSIFDNDVVDKKWINLNDHRILFDDLSTVTCKDCDEEHKIPQIIRESSGFTEVVYRLYLVGKVANTSCVTVGTSLGNKDTHRVHPDSGDAISSAYNPNKTYTKNLNLSDKQKMKLIEKTKEHGTVTFK